MASRGASQNVSWFVIGLLTGVAATLALLILFSAHSMRREAAVAPIAPADAVAHQPRKAALKPQTLVETPPASASPAPDEQVAEDAAAAGMTSRSHTPQGQ